MGVIGELVFDIDIESEISEILATGKVSTLKNNIDYLFAKGTRDRIGTVSWSYIDTLVDDYHNIQGNYVFYLPEGTIAVFLGGRYKGRYPNYPLPIYAGTGNFQNAIGSAVVNINPDRTQTVTITFYDKPVYPLV
jgi:hypothetical protein